MTEDFLNFLLTVVIIIVAAKASGYLSIRLRQPSVLGELLAGILLGPTLFDMLHWPLFAGSEHILGELITVMAELGVILLMLLAGLGLHLSELLQSGKVATLAGVLGVVVPLGTGWGTAWLFGIGAQEGLFIGLILAATSVSISAQTLLEMGKLQSRVGLALLGAAVFDDILVILGLSLAFILVSDAAGGVARILLTLGGMVVYLLAAIAFGLWLLPRLVSRIDRLPISQGTMAVVLVLTLLYAWAAEVIGGMAAITGAFLVGLFLARLPFSKRIEQGVSTVAYGFFVPIFFVNIGLAVNLRAITGSAWILAIVITVVAVLSKLLGSGLGAKLSGFNQRESVQVGIGMISRGEVGLIVASFALMEQLITPASFSIAVFVVIMATLVTPPMLRAAFAGKSQPENTTPPH